MKAHLVLVILLVSSIYASSPCNRNSDPSCWVYGNHYDSTAYDFCAIGSVGCMRSSAEPIDVTQENDEVYNYPVKHPTIRQSQLECLKKSIFESKELSNFGRI
mmetsp:Transcript_14264/g.19887  ORF Transcript_14264/g.19887 Transcript_14264/m.19887 type:complete len:103 (-) Transcript_14264:435-743(-)